MVHLLKAASLPVRPGFLKMPLVFHQDIKATFGSEKREVSLTMAVLFTACPTSSSLPNLIALRRRATLLC